MTLGREASSSRPLECVDLQLISNSLDFSYQETCYWGHGCLHRAVKLQEGVHCL